MREKLFEFIVNHEENEESIDKFLLKKLETNVKIIVSRKHLQKLFLTSLVKLNGSIEKFRSKKIKTNDKIEIKLSVSFLREHNKTNDKKFVERINKFEIKAENIIYEDRVLLIANKPFGLPSQGTLDPTRDHFYAALMRYLEKKDGKNYYLALHHRLDSDTSGIMLFCKKKSFNKQIAELFQNRLIKKSYLAVVDGNNCQQLPIENFRVENFLQKIRVKNFLISKSVFSGGEKAITDFKMISNKGNLFLLECCPLTGRMHQIRVHLAERGMPILGDIIYGNRESANRLMLHAHKLEFIHPETQKRVEFMAPMPQSFMEYIYDRSEISK